MSTDSSSRRGRGGSVLLGQRAFGGVDSKRLEPAALVFGTSDERVQVDAEIVRELREGAPPGELAFDPERQSLRFHQAAQVTAAGDPVVELHPAQRLEHPAASLLDRAGRRVYGLHDLLERAAILLDLGLEAVKERAELGTFIAGPHLLDQIDRKRGARQMIVQVCTQRR